MSAPVSREVPTSNGLRYPRQITLSGEERQIARISFAHLPPDQAEAAYAANKAKMLRLKSEGVIVDQGG